jgi:hypothetical protein
MLWHKVADRKGLEIHNLCISQKLTIMFVSMSYLFYGEETVIEEVEYHQEKERLKDKQKKRVNGTVVEKI